MPTTEWNRRPSRRAVLGGGIGALALLPAAPAFASPGALLPAEPIGASEETITNLGPALRTVNVRSVEFGTLPDGRAVAYATSNGEPASFNVIDTHTGERIFAAELDGATLGGFIATAPDGMIYFSARHPMKGGLLSFDPATFEITVLAENIDRQLVLYGGAFDENGTLYFGTYPDAKVYSYTPSSGELRDYGSQTDDAAYVFSLGIVDGEIWAGTGPVPHLFRIDPATGDRTEMSPPAHVMEGTDWFIAVEQRDDLVFVRLSPRGTYDMAVYDLSSERWLDQIVDSTFATAVSAPTRNQQVFYLEGNVLRSFHLRSHQVRSTGFEDTDLWARLSPAVGTYGIAVLDVPGQPADTVVGLNTDGDLWQYNIATGRTQVVRADILGARAGAHSLGVGPDGAVYIGAYLSSGVMGRIDQETEEIEQLRGPKQSDTISSHNGQIVVSSYPGAVVHVGDVSGESQWSDFDKVLELERGAPNYQDRIFALGSIGDRLAVGSVPDYGQLGGALTLVDPATGEYEFHRDVVPEQSIVSLAVSDSGMIYGGTSIHGGLSSSPTQTSARIFGWDADQGALVFEHEVAPGAEVIPRLLLGPQGMLWGLASDGTVFAFDTASGAVIHQIETGLAVANSWGRSSALFHRTTDGMLYAAAGGSLIRFDPDTLATEVIVSSGAKHAIMDGQERIYFASDIDVYRVTV